MGVLSRVGLALALLAPSSQSHAVTFGDVGFDLIQELAVNSRTTHRVARRAVASSTVWLIIASRADPQEAVELAESFSATLGPMLVVLSRNGRYAILAGTLNKNKAKSNLEALKDLRLIPGDSFLSDGTNLERVIWRSSAEAAPLDLMRQPAYQRSVSRLQAAFSRLQLYDGPVDGLVGPSTTDAFAAYIAAYGIANGAVLDDYALTAIENTVADGFRTVEERQIAKSRGFSDAEGFAQAKAGGFTSAYDFNEARQFGFNTLHDWERSKAGGFASKDEYEQAVAGGFTKATEYQKAHRAGFSNRVDYMAADAGGFATASTFYDAGRLGFLTSETYEAFRRSGFRSADAYRSAVKGGFTNPAEFTAAADMGFASRDEYRRFLASGAADRKSFLAAQALEARKIDARSMCLAALAKLDRPVKTVESCLTAIQLGAYDAALRTAFAELGKALSDRRAALAAGHMSGAATEVASTSMGDGAPASATAGMPAAATTSSRDPSAGTFLQEMAELDRALALHACGAAFQAGDFAAAEKRCRATATDTDIVDVLAALQASAAEKAENARREADALVERQRREAQAEQQRLALEAARTKAAELLKNVGEFTGAKRTLAAPIEVAKAVVAVRQSTTGRDVTALEQANGRLEALLAREGDYKAFLEERATAAQVAERNARTTAATELARLQGFIEAYVAQNILSEHVDALLALQATLAEAGASNETERLIRAQKEGRQRIASLGLRSELDAFKLPVSGPSVADDAAEKAKDAQREADALAEHQRKEAKAEEQRLALDAARTKADKILKSVGAFTAAKGKWQSPLDIARGVAAVRQGAKGSQVAALEQANTGLEALLAKEAAYRTFVAERTTAEQVAGVNARTTAAAEVERLQAFLQAYVADNVLSEHLDELLTLQTSLTGALASNDAGRLIQAQKDGRERIASLGLEAELEAFTVPKTAATSSGDVEQATNGLAVTPMNRALLTGDPRDVLILGNYTPSAPHLVINLLGETVFDGRSADLCWWGAPAGQTPLGRMALSKLAGMGIDAVGEPGACDPRNLMGRDVVLLQRGEFLKSDVLAARGLVQVFEKEDLRLLASVAWSEAGEAADRDTRTAKAIEAGVLAGARKGFGLVSFDKASNRVCLVVADGDQPIHEAVLANAQSSLDRFVHADAETTAMPLDRAFVRVQRRECSAVYAGEADMKALLAGLKRAKLAYAVLPVWIEPEQVNEAAAGLARQADAERKALAARQQADEGEARLAEAKAGEADAVRRREEASLRERYGQEARAAFNDVSELGKRFFNDDKNARVRFAALFPQIDRWKADRDKDRWELDTYDSALLDYGTAEWQGRRTEVVFARLNVRSRNRQLGQYADDCFTVGYLIDAEFAVTRDAVESTCRNADATVAAWKKGRAFESRWVQE